MELDWSLSDRYQHHAANLQQHVCPYLYSIRLLHKLDKVTLLLCRLYMDIIAWSYLGAVFALFLIFKVGFLLLAWNNPQRYLQYKSII